MLQNLGINYQAVRNYEAAEKIFDRGLAVAPRDQALGLHSLRAQLAIAWKGDLEPRAWKDSRSFRPILIPMV